MDYGFASEIGPDDDRQACWAKQRATRGFDDAELWNLDATFCRFMVPRLIAFKEIAKTATPGSIKTNEEWLDIIQQMIDGFQLIIDDIVLHTPEQEKKIEAASELFAKHFRSLWY